MFTHRLCFFICCNIISTRSFIFYYYFSVKRNILFLISSKKPRCFILFFGSRSHLCGYMYTASMLHNCSNPWDNNKHYFAEQASANRSSRYAVTKYVPIYVNLSLSIMVSKDFILYGYRAACTICLMNFVNIAGAGDHPKGRPTAS